MEGNEIQRALALAVEEVLETMYFTTVLASSETAVPHESSCTRVIAVSLRFEGNPSGGFRLSIPMKLGRVVSAGFLGREEAELSDSQAEDVVCEMGNMICGSVLSRLESKVTFQIFPPELTPSDGGSSFGGDSTCRWFDLGDGLLITTLQLSQAV